MHLDFILLSNITCNFMFVISCINSCWYNFNSNLYSNICSNIMSRASTSKSVLHGQFLSANVYFTFLKLSFICRSYTEFRFLEKVVTAGILPIIKLIMEFHLLLPLKKYIALNGNIIKFVDTYYVLDILKSDAIFYCARIHF